MEPGNGNGLVYIGIPRERIYLTQFIDNRDHIIARLQEVNLAAGLFQAEGHRVDRNRDKIVSEFLKCDKEPEWLVMLDTDMDHPIDICERLIRWKKPIVGGLYFHRGTSHDPFAFRNAPDMTDEFGRTHRAWAPLRDEVYAYLMENGIPMRDGAISILTDDPSHLLECDAVATGAICIHRSVLEAMKPGPWFEYKAGGISEDLAFCADAKEIYGFPIYCDLSTISGHYNWVAMGQSQFRMRYEHRGMDLSSYTKREAAGMWADAFGVSEEEAIKEIEAGSGAMVGTLWNKYFKKKAPTAIQEDAFYRSDEAGKAYIMELLHWNYSPDFQRLRQTLVQLRHKNIIEVGAGIGTVSLQLIAQMNDVVAIEPNALLRAFIVMRYTAMAAAVETDIGGLDILDTNFYDNAKRGSFQVAVAFDVFEHMPLSTLRRTVRALRNLLAPGGHLVYHATWKLQELYPMHHDHSAVWPSILADNDFSPVSEMEAIRR